MKQQILFALCVEYENSGTEGDSDEIAIDLDAIQHKLEHKLADAIEVQRQDSMLSFDGHTANFITLEVIRIGKAEKSEQGRYFPVL